MITPIQSYNYSYKRDSAKLAFEGRELGLMAAPAEKSIRKVEFAGRKILNRIIGLFNKNNNNEELYNALLNSDIKSEEYIHILNKISRIFSTKKEIEINIENQKLEKIASSETPHIFIMNHDNQRKDPKMLAFFNTLLNYEYIKAGKTKTCPRPRIILNEDILLSMQDLNRKIFEKLGAVGIDASLYEPNAKTNAKAFITLIKEFLNKEVNIFIFPEGKNAVYKNASLKEKFQTGVAKLVAKIADIAPEVKVVPLGFAYGKRFGADSIFIGETVTLKKQGFNMEASIGNINSKFARDSYKDFYNGRESAVLTDNSKPVKGRALPEYIAGVLCENLRICKEEANAAIK